MPSLLERLREALAPNFTVERELGSGGMGLVFLGHDRSLDRSVAIKVLRPELATAIAAERFVREAQYLAGLNHPNLVSVHLAGQANGLAYYIMDHIDGKTLDTRLSEGALPPAEVLALGRDLLAALAAAHAKGIIHRDIKPGNIFLVGSGALLGDFGIAQGPDADGDPLTRPGQIIGTLAYMAPEQLSGSAVTPQTDLYAVGLVLYQACTGRRRDLLADPDSDDWTDVPPTLIPAPHTPLQRAPEDRWDSAKSVARALTGRGAWLRRAPAGAMVLTALAVFAGVYRLGSPERAQTSNVALYPFEVAGFSDTALGAQLSRLTASYLEALPGITVAPVRATFQSWRGSSLPPGQRLAQLTGSPAGAEYGVWGVVRPAAGGIEVQLQAVNAR